VFEYQGDWIFLGGIISQKVAAKNALAGLVLDTPTCFNILDRRLLRALILHFGFLVIIVDAWMAMLSLPGLFWWKELCMGMHILPEGSPRVTPPERCGHFECPARGFFGWKNSMPDC